MIRNLVAGTAALALLLAMDTLRLFGGQQWLSALVGIETQYFYALLGLLAPWAFITYPRRAWLDWPLAIVFVAILVGFFVTAEQALDEAWEFAAPEYATYAALALWLMLLEALRRAAGWPLCIIAGAFSVLPVITEFMPGPLSGLPSSWAETASYHLLSIESVFGLPFRAFADLVIGFVVFGVVLQFTGGGQFFLNLAFAILGRQRGGPAKVAIVSSGLMGSMSGSVVTNVLTTGQLTIPAMRKSGMAREVAGGVEACASTGGVLLPPIMGSTAFVMATLLDIAYIDVAAAAALPAFLYFASLYLQIDAYAGRENVVGLAEEDIPALGKTIAEGWFYLGAFALLIFLLIFLQQESIAPYYATAALLVLNQFSPKHRLDLQGVVDLFYSVGKLLIELVVVLAGVGLIVGSLSLTGLSGTLVNDLLSMAGEDIGLLLLMGALTSFVLGIGMTVTAAYIFLAVVLAPALVSQNLDPLSVHLFILYWAMLSYITPPVALGAYAAASIAEANALKTGFAAMRLGSVIYIIPFIFVLDVAFILQGPWYASAQVFAEAIVGVWLICAGLQGYLAGLGRLDSPAVRTLVSIGGLLIALPQLNWVLEQPPSNLASLGAGVALAVMGLILQRARPQFTAQ